MNKLQEAEEEEEEEENERKKIESGEKIKEKCPNPNCISFCRVHVLNMCDIRHKLRK